MNTESSPALSAKYPLGKVAPTTPTGLSAALEKSLLDCLEATSDMVCLVDADGGCLYMNAEGYRQTGFRLGPEPYSIFSIFSDRETPSRLLKELDGSMSSCRWSGEAFLVGGAVADFPVSVVMTTSPHPTGEKRILIQLRPLTQRYQAERALTEEILRCQDEARRQIGRYLHDSTAQTLAALEIQLSRWGQNASPQFDRDQMVQDCIGMAARCSLELRSLSVLLHPPLLKEFGLCQTLRWYAARFTERSGVAVHVIAPDNRTRWPEILELALFRITQEALLNILRHSGGSDAHVQLDSDRDSLFLKIEDHGRGFPERKYSPIDSTEAGVGLLSLQERIRHLRGHLSIESRPGLTRIEVHLPLPSPPP